MKTKPINASERLEYKHIYCSNNCGKELKVHPNVESVLCWRCTIKKIYRQIPIIEKKASNRPRGWQFMKEFVDVDGTVYFEGVEQPKLKGKKPITDTETIRKKQKSKSIEKKKNKILNAEKKEHKLLLEYEKKKKIKKKLKDNN